MGQNRGRGDGGGNRDVCEGIGDIRRVFVVYSTTYGDRDTGRAAVWINRREQPPGGLPHSVTHGTLHATLNDTYFTESTRLEDMIRVESAARSAAGGCHHLVQEPPGR
ncbi:MAG: hypothetical protein F4139_06940 [Gemmatimonadetes bacterium]|nr:hypothetical protein [Gemmatimonadota bacterium]MYA63994.1 hypothetical protein [Gemmatimonadota bacterium]MYB98495.1 hypothetical protein [Gemmatimonadota bacterium]MYH52672.1 hypothetical protein [Gemmatimonadota bacterium]